jgi:hypothetical protein
MSWFVAEDGGYVLTLSVLLWEVDGLKLVSHTE